MRGDKAYIEERNISMKKLSKLLSIVCVCAAAISLLAGCGKKEEDMVYLKDFKASDYVELGEYKGLEIVSPDIEVSEEEINDYVDYILSSSIENVEIEGRDVVKNGDIANIDYEGKKDGVAFEGGTAQGTDLKIGSGQFIPGFEDGVIGMKIGETKDIELSFPDTYPNEELAGKPVVFTVKLNSIKEEVVPELTDEFVASLNEGVSTVAEYKEQVKNGLMSEKAAEAEDAAYTTLQKMIEEGSSFKDAPSGFVDRLYNTLIKSLQEAATSYGVDIGTIAQYYYGVTPSNYQAELRDFCKDTLARQYIMMGAIAEAEGIEVTDADVDSDIQAMLDSYGSQVTLDEYKKNIGDLESYREYLIVNNVLEFVKANAVEK